MKKASLGRGEGITMIKSENFHWFRNSTSIETSLKHKISISYNHKYLELEIMGNESPVGKQFRLNFSNFLYFLKSLKAFNLFYA